MTGQTRRVRSWLALIAIVAMAAACADQPSPLGLRTKTSNDVFGLRVPAPGPYTQVVSGSFFTCALRTDGVIDCVGSVFGQVGPFTKTPATGVFTSLSAFSSTVCAIRSDGAIECWGDNQQGQGPALVTPPSGESFVAVGVGILHSCAVRSTGGIHCWGYNFYGQAPALQLASSGVFVSVSAGGRHTCGLNSNGAIECFGDNEFGFAPPLMTAANGTFTKVIVDQSRTCGLRSDGVVQCAGQHIFAGTFIDYDSYFNECGINTSGVAQCAGDNSYGQAPASRAASTGSFTQVTTAAHHTCALRTDGAIECWGIPDRIFGAVLPTATFGAPTSVIVGQPIALSLTNPQVPGYPLATSFTFAFDCGDGAGFGSASGTASANCSTTSAGTRSVGGRVIDQDGDYASYTASVTIKTAQQGTTDLRTEISLAGLSPDIRTALMTKLDAALSAIAKGKTSSACGALKDFINQVNAQKGKAIDATTADAWILSAQQLQAAIGC